MGIGYYVFYLVGISGKGRGITGARATAAVLNQTRPRLIGTNMLTVFPNSELAVEIASGRWEEEGEVEKYREVQELVRGLTITTEFAMGGASNAVFVAGRLPGQASEIVAALDQVIDRVGEDELRRYRTGLRHL